MKKILMSAVALTVFSLSIILFQISCKKDVLADVTPGPSSIKGLWIGTYTTDTHPDLGEQYFSLIIKPDGTMIADTKGDAQQHLAPGTWTLKADTLTCTFTCVYGIASNIGITETAVAVWDKTTKLHGIWKNSPTPIGSGTITLTKVN
jgi:hypothetical protein